VSLRFDFATSQRITFGRGALETVGPEACARGRRALLVTGRHPDRANPLVENLRSNRVTAVVFPVAGEPTTESICEGTPLAKMNGCDLVIGFGGGSAIDAAKAIAALVTNTGDLLKYLEVIGEAHPLERPSLPCIAIPTTAGTGAEVTRNAVLSSPRHGVKVSLRSPTMLPVLAIVDPDLTDNLPPDLTASTGMDALTQLIEAYVCTRANPMTDALCVEGINRAARSLLAVYRNGENADARDDMALASLFSGLALANAGLGAVHGFAGPIGGMFSAPHGTICASLLRHVIEFNILALEKRQPQANALARYDHVGRILTGEPKADRNDAIAWVTQLARDLSVPRLEALGITRGDFRRIAEKAAVASSMKANPITFTTEELQEILDRAA
jgi:alcohol dehydrogenase class IV